MEKYRKMWAKLLTRNKFFFEDTTMISPYFFFLNSYFEEYIYIVIHRQSVSLYHNSLVWLDT